MHSPTTRKVNRTRKSWPKGSSLVRKVVCIGKLRRNDGKVVLKVIKRIVVLHHPLSQHHQDVKDDGMSKMNRKNRHRPHSGPRTRNQRKNVRGGTKHPLLMVQWLRPRLRPKSHDGMSLLLLQSLAQVLERHLYLLHLLRYHLVQISPEELKS